MAGSVSTSTIAAVFPLDAIHGHGMFRGVTEFARSRPGLRVVQFGNPKVLSIDFLKRLDVDGMIVKVSSLAEEALLVRRRIPVVNISGQIATPRLMTVNTDDRLVGELAAEYLYQRGYRVLAYYGDSSHRASVLRCEGFMAAARKIGVASKNVYVRMRHESGHLAQIHRSLVTWLKRIPGPAGLLSFDDLDAYDVATACAVAGIRVPEDIGIIGVGNDTPRLSSAPVELSAVALDSRQIGLKAAELVFGMMKGESQARKEWLIPPQKFVTRRSTDSYAVNDEIVTRALGYIRENLGNPIYVDAVARYAGCSRRSLEMRFKSQVGMPIYEHVQRQQFERAKAFLENPGMTIAEVAIAAGYTDSTRLGIEFRRRLKTSPGKYRKTMAIGTVA